MAERLARWVIWKVKALIACAVFGVLYGAVCGAVYGGLLTLGPPAINRALFGDDDSIPIASGTILGICFGGFMGGLSGLIGGSIGGPLGWCLAGALGAMVPFGLGPLLSGSSRPDFWLFGLAPPLIGGALGLAVGFGLRRGRSVLPGVRHLAVALENGRPNTRNSKAPDIAAEVMPSAAPEGRGDEVAPR